mmetsp:Transcript_3641/g.5099  ORF Transcript_3641/g.5099 Transcript_3641/m.5099 type:complete len:200 (+) Transcript_3641:42-641(+)
MLSMAKNSVSPRTRSTPSTTSSPPYSGNVSRSAKASILADSRLLTAIAARNMAEARYSWEVSVTISRPLSISRMYREITMPRAKPMQNFLTSRAMIPPTTPPSTATVIVKARETDIPAATFGYSWLKQNNPKEAAPQTKTFVLASLEPPRRPYKPTSTQETERTVSSGIRLELSYRNRDAVCRESIFGAMSFANEMVKG